MDEYLNKYDCLNKILVYDFKIGCGGIGDLIKFFIYLVNFAIKYNIKIHYLINDIPLEKYLRLKYKKFYIKNKDMYNTLKISNESDIFTIKPYIYNLISPSVLYNIFSYETLFSYDQNNFTPS